MKYFTEEDRRNGKTRKKM